MTGTELKPWSPSYSVGVDSLDGDHRMLLGMINKLHQAMSTGQSKSMLTPLISELKTYSMTHFRNEEGYLEMIHYPHLDEQRRQHGVFVSKIQEFETELGRGNMMLAMRVMPFLNDWLLQHIMNVDMQYSKK